MRTPATATAFAAFAERADRLRPGIARVGSSDYHQAPAPGFCRTWVLARERSAAGVIAAVREGRTVAMDMDGRLYGDAEAVRLVQGASLAKPAPPRTAGLERGAAAAAVVGLLLLVLL